MVLLITKILYFLLYFLSLLRFRYCIIIFVIFLPLNSLIDTKFLNLFAYNSVFILILFFHLIQGNYLSVLINSPKSSYIKNLFWFGFILWILSSIITFKQSIFYNIDLGFIGFIGRITVNLFLYIDIFCLVILMKNPFINKICQNAILFSSLLIILSIPCSPYLASKGLSLSSITPDVINTSGLFTIKNRFPGIFSGSINTLGTFLNITFAFFLIKYHSSRKIFVPIFLFYFVGVLLTLSRMAFVTFGAISISHLVLNLRMKLSFNKLLTYFLIIMIATLICNTTLYDLLIERIVGKNMFFEIGVEGHRYIRWIKYIDYVLSDFFWTLFGVNKHFNYGRDAHSVFVDVFYYGGLSLLLPFLYVLFRMLFLAKKENNLNHFILIYTPIFISMIIIGSLGYIDYFFLLAASLYYNKKIIYCISQDKVRNKIRYSFKW
jgi:hypothetical protein